MKSTFGLFFLLACYAVQAQKPITWKTLEDVTYKEVYYEETDSYYWYPTFGETVKSLVGKEISIRGYMIPVDINEGLYVLSAFPFASCFFCGGAGPQSVIELQFKSKPRRYDTDERLVFKGKLKTNAEDIYRMNYILEEAEQTEKP